MKAKELMIGDLVQSFPYQCIVDGIICLREVHTADEKWMAIVHLGGNKYEQVKVDILEPIPLTPEILEKNGFERKMRYIPIYEGYKYYVIDRGNDVCIEYDGMRISLVLLYECYTGSIESNGICPLDYVHELQHALKLCGIEKEIVL